MIDNQLLPIYALHICEIWEKVRNECDIKLTRH